MQRSFSLIVERAVGNMTMETAPVRMSAEDFEAFLKALSEPAQRVPELIELMRRPAPWEEQHSGRGY